MGIKSQNNPMITSEHGKPIGVGRTAEILPYKPGQVLKLFYDWCPRFWAEKEAMLTEKAYARGLPVPLIYGLHERDGRVGIVMQYIAGKSMLTSLREHPIRLWKYARLLADLQFSINSIYIEQPTELLENLNRRIKNNSLISNETRVVALNLLDSLKNDSHVCHMDFHPDNILLTDAGPVIIDWSNLCLAAPAADVARSLLIMTVGNPPQGTPGLWLINLVRHNLINGYLRRYLGKKTICKKEMESWLIPIAIARLDEEITKERRALLNLIDRYIYMDNNNRF
jgi:hypothetical protein